MRRVTVLHQADVLVLVLCVAFLLMSLGSVGPRGRTRVKEFVCRSHLRQWGPIFNSSVQDNAGSLPLKESSDSDNWWMESLWPYHKDKGLLACPTATDVSEDVPATHRAWTLGQRVGSFGLNGWIHNPGTKLGIVHGNRPATYCWPTPRTWEADRVPMLADMCWTDAWPLATDQPQAVEQSMAIRNGYNEMQRVCINRHDGGVNILFLDGSVHKAGLKELWTLKWHRVYNTQGPFTKAGGITPADWPLWMRGFKEF
jgi:prepilin-type processing-associated H-X9-DG protein